MECGGLIQYSHSLRKKLLQILVVPQLITSVSLARWQQGEQDEAVVGIVFYYPLGSAQVPHLTDITDAS